LLLRKQRGEGGGGVKKKRYSLISKAARQKQGIKGEREEKRKKGRKEKMKKERKQGSKNEDPREIVLAGHS
jgi:hypothetical protein